MEITGWTYYNHAAVPSTWPHEDVNIEPIKNGSIWKICGGTPALVRWTSDFDCPNETQFYWCIKDDTFDISKLKAKRRYEINRGIKNFEVRIIDPRQYVDEIYEVYLESLKGYPDGTIPDSKDKIIETANRAWSQAECRFFGAFEKSTGRLCGYCDIYERGKYIPISSMKSRVDCEKQGVNFAIVYGIIEWFNPLTQKGCYLCDGARNVFHATHFQDFLIKYFEFRKAYCKLHIVYRPLVKWCVFVLFPIRGMFENAKNKRLRMIHSVLKMEAWRRGLPK